jgi:sugar phosphate isomerase/epimerase
MPQGIQFAVVASALTDEIRLAPARAREAGFAGLQFDVRSPLLDVLELSSTGRREFLHLLSSYDQQLVGLRADVNPHQLAPGADIDRILDGLDRAMSAAAQLHAPLLCLDVGPLSPASGLALAELAARADRQGVLLALRSELSSFADLAAAINPIGSPWLGIDLDPVAILRDDWKLDQVLANLGPLIRHLHGRDALAGANHRTQVVPLGRGHTKWLELFAALDAGAFKGWLTVDPLDLRDRPAAAVAGLAYLRSL